MNDEPATNAELPAARRRVRRYVLLKGAFMALAVVTGGLVYAWLPSGWWRSIVLGSVLVLLVRVTEHLDRASSARGMRVRIPLWVSLLVTGLTAAAVAALADQFVARYVAVVAAAAAVMLVWAVISWRVSR